jgi:hypothetical protein
MPIRLTLPALFFVLSASAQQKEYTIPFELTDHNNLSLQAVLNGKDTLQLMFHTAEGSSVDLTKEATKRVTSLRFDGADTIGSWGGGENITRFSRNNTLEIGGLHRDSLTIWEDLNSGQHTDGKFGPGLFAGKVIQIDFDQKRMTLRSTLPDSIGQYEKLRLVREHAMLFVEAVAEIDGVAVPNRFLIHSGYFGALLLDDSFVQNNHIDERLRVIDEKELKDSFGHVIKTKKAILPALRLGQEVLTDVPVGFFSGTIGRQKMSIIGGDVLKRFNIIIDARREYIYLKPNGLAKTAWWS